MPRINHDPITTSVSVSNSQIHCLNSEELASRTETIVWQDPFAKGRVLNHPIRTLLCCQNLETHSVRDLSASVPPSPARKKFSFMSCRSSSSASSGPSTPAPSPATPSPFTILQPSTESCYPSDATTPIIPTISPSKYGIWRRLTQLVLAGRSSRSKSIDSYDEPPVDEEEEEEEEEEGASGRPFSLHLPIEISRDRSELEYLRRIQGEGEWGWIGV